MELKGGRRGRTRSLDEGGEDGAAADASPKRIRAEAAETDGLQLAAVAAEDAEATAGLKLAAVAAEAAGATAGLKLTAGTAEAAGATAGVKLTALAAEDARVTDVATVAAAEEANETTVIMATPATTNLPRQLPWLLFPSSKEPLVHETLKRNTRGLDLPDDIMKWGTMCGSSEGSWLFIRIGQVNLMFNTSTGQRISLPSSILMEGQAGRCLSVKMEAAALSGPPIGSYSVGAIVWAQDPDIDFSSIAIWEPPMKHWVHVHTPWDDIKVDGIEIPDIIYCKSDGCFYCLTADEEVKKITRAGDPDGEARVDEIPIQERHDFVDEKESYSSLQRYLLDSGDGDGILMIIKYQRGLVTSLVRVFRLQRDDDSVSEEQYGEDAGRPNSRVMKLHKHYDSESEEEIKTDFGEQYWQEVEPPNFWQDLDLDVELQFHGKVMFLGRACSRAYDGKDFGLSKDNSPTVYFLDDRGHKESGRSPELTLANTSYLTLVSRTGRHATTQWRNGRTGFHLRGYYIDLMD